MTTGAYALEVRRGPAAGFHERQVPDPPTAAIWVHEVDAPALVLGSNQDEATIDRAACERAGVDVVRRRSGGGAVLLRPGEVGWFDVIVPSGSTGWVDDVQRQMVWLGDLVAGVIIDATDLDPNRLRVHTGPMISTAWSRVICFDGVGGGEVLLDGAKLVGISQRRTRGWARLQCSWHTTYRADDLVDLLAPTHRPARSDLAPVAVMPAGAPDAVGLAGALRDHLPA